VHRLGVARRVGDHGVAGQASLGRAGVSLLDLDELDRAVGVRENRPRFPCVRPGQGDRAGPNTPSAPMNPKATL
jgi:hypothetical protein